MYEFYMYLTLPPIKIRLVLSVLLQNNVKEVNSLALGLIFE